MRITNPMISNSMLLNINRNANRLNFYYGQLSTGKKIQVPSDDPLLASRALKFRTNVSETEQYLKNVSQGLSWTEVTEAAFRNAIGILGSIKDLSERAANDILTPEDRDKVLTDIKSLVDQIGHEMNVTYAGRYVFSGYRTDQPPVITEDSPNLSYLGIEQTFAAKDVQYTKAYVRNEPVSSTVPATADKVLSVAVIKLAYTGLTQEEFDNYAAAASPAGTPNPAITVVSLDPASSNYWGPAGLGLASPYAEGNYIQETGELVLRAEPYNPNTQILPVTNVPSLIRYDILPAGTTDAGGDPIGRGGLKQGELNPQIYFTCTDATPDSPTFNKIFNNPDDITGKYQYFDYEFSVNTRVRVNSNAPDVLTDKMYADYQSMVGVLQYITGNTREQIYSYFTLEGLTGEALDDAVAQEMQKIQMVAQDRFSDLMGLADSHISSVTREHADLGSRMHRLELIQGRLEDDRINYTKLLSDNEDTDYSEAMTRLSALEAVYQASLSTGARIMSLTLANYI